MATSKRCLKQQQTSKPAAEAMKKKKEMIAL